MQKYNTTPKNKPHMKLQTKQGFRRVPALLLILALCLSLFSNSAMASEGSEHTITGFASLSEEDMQLSFPVSEKPDLETLLSQMPDTLTVYLDGETKPTQINVSWACAGEDYEASDSNYFQFSPVWDTSQYTLSAEIDLFTEAPYIGVFLSDDGELTLFSYTGTENETIIFNFLTANMGFNRAVACGIMANMYAESLFDPTAVGDNGTSHGICQWHNSRWTSLVNWCSANGLDPNSLYGQLFYLKFELSQNNSSYLWNGRTIYNYISALPDTADGAYEAGRYWCYTYEVPANKETVSVTRGNLTKDRFWPANADTPIPDIPFPDVQQTDWFYSAVSYMYTNEIMTGLDNGLFAPAQTISRAEVAVILFRMNGSPDGDWTNSFPDVENDSWYQLEVSWAASVGIVTGYTSNNHFGPADNITREQLAVMLYRYAQYQGLSVSASGSLDAFPDAARVSDYAKDAMTWAVSTGIISGKYSPAILDPSGNATRAECAVMIARFLQYYS